MHSPGHLLPRLHTHLLTLLRVLNELPGVPLERTQMCWNEPNRKVGSRGEALRPTALDTSLFAWPWVPDGGTR